MLFGGREKLGKHRFVIRQAFISDFGTFARNGETIEVRDGPGVGQVLGSSFAAGRKKSSA